MTYKGYRIIAEVNVNSLWDIAEDENGHIQLTDFIDEGEADDVNIADLVAEDAEGERLIDANGEEYFTSIEQIKAAIDKLTAVKTSDGHRVKIEVK